MKKIITLLMLGVSCSLAANPVDDMTQEDCKPYALSVYSMIDALKVSPVESDELEATKARLWQAVRHVESYDFCGAYNIILTIKNENENETISAETEKKVSFL